LNSATAPLADYFATPPSAPKLAVDSAFVTAFGITQSDPAVVAIPPASFSAFLDGAFAGLFTPAGWSATWSAATDVTAQSRVNGPRFAQTAVSANAEPFRQLAQAFAMIADLGVETLSRTNFEAAADRAMALASSAAQGLGALQGTLGHAQQLINSTNETLGQFKSRAELMIAERERVDQAEAITRVNELVAGLEASYRLTARLSDLSLANYL
jgi:flagellar hook-associated protein 3 FlgL